MLSPDDFSAVSIEAVMAADNWQQQYRLIIESGKLIRAKPEIRQPQHLIKGCELPVWLAHYQSEGRHHFLFDSDSRVMNGLAALLLVQLENKTDEEIGAIDFNHRLRQLKLERHLTPSRNNGFKAIVARALALVENS